jgi:hypothetical protein
MEKVKESESFLRVKGGKIYEVGVTYINCEGTKLALVLTPLFPSGARPTVPGDRDTIPVKRDVGSVRIDLSRRGLVIRGLWHEHNH